MPQSGIRLRVTEWCRHCKKVKSFNKLITLKWVAAQRSLLTFLHQFSKAVTSATFSAMPCKRLR